MAEQRPTYEELRARVAEYDSLFEALRTQQADAVVGTDHVSMLRPHDLEMALRASEERFRQLANNMAQLAWISDAEGRAIWFNSRFEEFSGLDIGLLDPQDRLLIHHPDHRERLQRRWAECVAEGTPFEELLPLRHKDGDYRWFLSRALPLRDQEGRITGWLGTNTDVTEQREAEEALRDSERMLSLIYNNTSDVLYLARVEPDERYTFTSVNDTFLRVSGYDREQVEGRPMEEVVPAANVELVRGKYREAISERKPVAYYETADLPAGRRHAQITIVPIFEEDGPVTHLLASIADLTERHIAEDARQLADARYRAIVESSDDAIVSKDLDGTITSWNRGAERIFGYGAEEIIGRSVKMLIPPELYAEEEEILARLRRNERVEHFETIRLRKDGSRLHISLTISPIKNERGEIVGASKVARDVSVQHALRESQERFRTMIDALPTAIYTTDAEGRITHFNPAAVEMAGRMPEIGSDHWCVSWKLFHADGTPMPHDKCPMAIALKEGRVVRGEEAILERPDGTRLWFTPYPTPLRDATGRVVGGINMLVNITERKAAEAALREADRRKDEFLAILAHELRSPLAPLSNALQLLDLVVDDPETGRRARTVMRRQLEHMVRLVDDLMDLSRVSRGVIDLHKAPTDLANALVQAVEATRVMIDQQGHRLEVHWAGEPLWVEGDATRLVQIFNNLLNNAAKYTDPGGSISARSERIGDRAVVTVSDTGIGIEPEKLGRVFDMFAQLEPSSTRAQSGLGIGLSIVKQLVQMHGGTITVSSEGRGRGSLFTVSLPLTTAPARRGSENGASGASGEKLRILVTDDNVESAVTMSMLLRKMGHEVRVTHNGKDALVEASLFKPQVVFLDIGMPVMDGYEVCRRIRASEGFDGTFMIALTGWGQDEDKRQAKEAGFDLHLVKPIGRDILVRTLNEVGARSATAH